jgi:serine/threonine protein kinase
VTHRDLKPENVFLVRDADSNEVWAKLLDFGIAKLLGHEDANKHRTRTGIPIGTPFYMSPEQCRGKDVDHRTDYYAFGVVAYQMLTGVLPFDGDDYMTVMMSQLADEPVPPSVINPELPAGIDGAIAALMKKHRDERPESLVSAHRAIERVAEDAGIDVPRATPIGLRVAGTPMPKSATAPGAASAASVSATSGELAPMTKRRGIGWLLGGAVIVAAVSAVIAVKVAGGAAAPELAAPAAPAAAAAAAPEPEPEPEPEPAAAAAAAPAAAPVPVPKRPRHPKKPARDDLIDVFGKEKP